MVFNTNGDGPNLIPLGQSITMSELRPNERFVFLIIKGVVYGEVNGVYIRGYCFQTQPQPTVVHHYRLGKPDSWQAPASGLTFDFKLRDEEIHLVNVSRSMPCGILDIKVANGFPVHAKRRDQRCN